MHARPRATRIGARPGRTQQNASHPTPDVRQEEGTPKRKILQSTERDVPATCQSRIGMNVYVTSPAKKDSNPLPLGNHGRKRPRFVHGEGSHHHVGHHVQKCAEENEVTE